MRVVSLLPSATEIVFALGRGEELVGVTFECDYPAEARQRRVVSTSALPEGLSPGEIDALVSERIAAGEDLYRLDERALADLDAELVLTQDLCAVCAVDVDRVDDALRYLECSAQVLTLDPRSLDDVLASITTVGTALGAGTRATAIVAELYARLDRLRATVADTSRPRVLVLEWTDPPFSAGHWVPDLVEAAGGHPVLAHPHEDSQRLTIDAVRNAAADVVVIAPCGYHLDAAVALGRDFASAGRVPAGANVWAVDADAFFVRPGPRVVDGAELLGQILHPGHAGLPDLHRAQRLTGT